MSLLSTPQHLLEKLLEHLIAAFLVYWTRVMGFWQDWRIGLKVMKERLKEELAPFAPEPWRRG